MSFLLALALVLLTACSSTGTRVVVHCDEPLDPTLQPWQISFYLMRCTVEAPK